MRLQIQIKELARNKFFRKFLFSIFFLFGIVIIVSTTFAEFVESNDSFCASCHVQPEKQYYLNSLQMIPRDLASFHAKKDINCIDCHSKPWITGRLISQFHGFKNFLTYKSGDFQKFNKTTNPVGSQACTKCHSDLFWSTDRSGHHHSPPMQAEWEQKGGPQNTCESCHDSHGKERKLSSENLMDPNLQNLSNNKLIFKIKKIKSMKKAYILDQCNNCHRALGETKNIGLEYFKHPNQN